MVTLNLLEPIARQQLIRERILLLLKDITAMTLIAVTVIAILLTISRAILANDLNETARRTNIITSSNQPVMQAIHNLNIVLKALNTVADEYTPWSRWLSSFASVIPAGNQISDLTLQRQERTITLRGRSAKRDNLLQFKSNLEASGLIEDISFPLSNLLLRENIDFEFSARLRPESL